MAPGGARWQPAPVAMNSITPMPTTVLAAQVLVDYESDELDLSDRTMCAFAIMLRAAPVMTDSRLLHHRCSVSDSSLPWPHICADSDGHWPTGAISIGVVPS